MGHAVLQKLVMDMLAIRGEDRTPADQTANHRKYRFQDGQAKGNDGDGNGNNGGSFLCSMERQGAQKKTDEEAAGIAQKNRGGIEVEAQKSENRTGQRDGHDFDEKRT